MIAKCQISEAQLRDFDAGRLDNARADELADHICECPTCEKRLETIVESGDFIQLLRQPNPLEEYYQDTEAGSATFSRGDLKDCQVNDVPDWVGDYFVVRVLGEGAFGRVLLAIDPHRERLVAIKMPRKQGVSDKVRASFLKEARAAARLQHSAIVPIFDCQELSNGQCCVVMKYIEGQTLKEAMKKRRFSPRRARQIVARIADALNYAHERNIYHRDVKPANILLDERGQPYLADFGLALHDEQQEDGPPEIAGTYAYMSPEQMRGEHLDQRSDIWSLGVVLYELLTDERPFRANTIQQLKSEVMEREPRAPRGMNGKVSKRVEKVCLQSLKKEVSQRYSTAADMSRDIRPISIQAIATYVATAVVLLAAGLAYAASDRGDPGVNGDGSNLGAASDPEKRGPVLPGQWLDFTAITPLARNLENTFNLWRPIPEQSRFDIQSGADMALGTFGQMSSERFHAKVSIAIDQWYGTSGIVFGLHDAPESRLGTLKHGYAVTIGRRVPAPHPVEVRFMRVDYVSDNGASWRCSNKDTYEVVPLGATLPESVELSMHVKDGRLQSVAVDGKEVAFQNPVDLIWPDEGSLEYGVVSIGNLTVFERGAINFY